MELGLFHKEMLSFLKEELGNRVGESELPASLREAVRTNSAVGFERIVGDVHKTLGEWGQGVEWKWISGLSEKEFRDAGLVCPRVYRGLPRLYRREDTAKWSIKEPFRNLNALRRATVDRGLVSLYERVRVSGKVVVLVWVIPDGLGDWMAALETAEIVRGIEGVEVEVMAVTSRALPKWSDVRVETVLYERMAIAHAFSEAQVRKLREADLILQIPTFFPDTKGLLERVEKMGSARPMPVVEHVGEYGYLESSWFHPKTENRSMGLHVLEKGILIREGSWFEELESGELSLQLFGVGRLTEGEWNRYRKKNHFHLAYLSTSIGGAIFLHALLQMWERDGKDIDVCLPDLGWFIRWVEERGEVLTRSFGVKQIDVVLKGERCVFPVSEKGKVVRLVCMGQISKGDMRRLMYLSEGWVGVRGNQTFSEAVSLGKPFFYDGQEHARYFVKDVVALAQNRLSGGVVKVFQAMREAFLWNLSEESGEWVDESHFQWMEKRGWEELASEIGEALGKEETGVGFKRFGEIVSREHRFNGFIEGLVRRDLWLKGHEKAASEEQRLLHLYGEGAISLGELVKNVKVGMMR